MKNNAFYISIVEFSFLSIFIFVLLMLHILNYISSTMVENENIVHIEKEVFNKMTETIRSNEDKLTLYDFLHNENNELKIQIANYENKNNELTKIITSLEIENARLRKEIEEQQKLSDSEIKEMSATIVAIMNDLSIQENELKLYENKYGMISDIPPDCSKTDLIDNYLFESIMINVGTISIELNEVPISNIVHLYNEDIQKAKDNKCVHKIKLYIDKHFSFDEVDKVEKALQRYFYVVKESIDS